MIVLDGDFHGWAAPAAGSAVTVGVYDGVHRGHRAVLARLGDLAVARGGLPVAVVTFDRHPLEIIDPGRAPATLTLRDEKLERLEEAGAAVVAILDFAAVRDLPSEAFATEILGTALDTRLLAVGSDFRFGRDRTGDVSDLARLGKRLGFDVAAVELVGDGEPVSSTAIRSALSVGDVSSAAAGLGRPYRLAGRVIAGDRRGARLGFPTANLEPHARALVPGGGVYAVLAGLAGEALPAVANIGTRPTFDGSGPAIEVHVLDWAGDLYGSSVAVDFIARLRDERRFADIAELRAQISIDVDRAHRLLDATPL